MNLFVKGKVDSDNSNRHLLDSAGNKVSAYKKGTPVPPDTVEDMNYVWTSQCYDELMLDDSYGGTTLTVEPYTFSLQQQSINSLIESLNYPLKHIKFGYDDNAPVYYYIKHSNGKYFKTRVVGEYDVSNQIYWDTYNGKLRFNHHGIPQIDTSDWTTLSLNINEGPGAYDDWIVYQGVTNYDLGKWPLPFGSSSSLTIKNYAPFIQQDKSCQVNFSYISQVLDNQDPLNIFASESLNNIYVQQLNPLKDNIAFKLDNFYWANQLMGFMQSPQQILDFMQNYTTGQVKTFYPQTQKNNYAITLAMSDNKNKYLKNLGAAFYIRKLETIDGFTSDYVNRSVILAKEFFLQLYREVYVLSPQLQSNTIIFKPENLKYTKTLRYCNTNNANGQNYINKDKNDTPYIFSDKLNCICYYVNSVSFNNYVSLQNNYPLQYQSDQKFDFESLRNLTFILTDENGCPLMRFSEFKDNTAQNKTTNFNRVLTDN